MQFGTKSLRRSFVFAVTLTYIAATGGAIIAFKIGAQNISDRFAARFAESQNRLEQNKILSIVDRELALSLKLADDPSIRAWMADETSPVRWGAAYAQLESYRKFLRDGAFFAAVKSSGTYYARTPGVTAIAKTTLNPSSPGDRWFYRTIQDNKDYSLNVDHNDLLNENRVWINVLVRDGKGDAIGVAGCGMDLTEFLEALVDHQDPGVATIIVDKDGFLQAHKDRRFIDYNAEVERDSEKLTIYDSLPNEIEKAALKAMIDALAAGNAAPPVTHLVLDGKKMLCAAGAVAELGWYNLVLIDTARIVDPRDFIPVGISTFGSLLLVLAGVLVTVDRLVLRPIKALNDAAGIVAAGAYDASVPEGSVGEIGELSVSFNAMTEKVREYTAGLEAMVGKRTKELNEANRNIMDSMRYARMIQGAIQPARAEAEKFLSELVVLSEPRDLVGGDFHFFAPVEDGFVAAAADCTGHGVPGALMAMMAVAHLRRVMDECGGAGPAVLIARLHRLVQESLGRGEASEHFDNGLDIGLCRYRSGTDTMEFAGAGISLFLLSGGVAEELKGDKGGIGYRTARTEAWEERRMEHASKARFYLATDGVLDLPGGDRGFGLGKERFCRLIEKAERTGADGRENFLRAALDEYRGERDQRDDLTLIGFKPLPGGSE